MDEELEKWINHWDKIQKDIVPETSNEKRIRTSFFTDTPNDIDYVPSQEYPSDDWNNILDRESLLFDAVAYAGEEGYGKQQTSINKTKKKSSEEIQLVNPIDPSTVGKDQQLRVSDNFSQGKDLVQLDKAKRELEELERKVHEAQVRDKSTKKLKNDLLTLRKKVEKLSQKLVPSMERDLA